MFSKEEARQHRIDFWTAFGVYMRQHTSASGTKQKWVNYHTGVKGIFFRLDAEPKYARVAITIEHHDPGIRSLFFEQWQELKTYLHTVSEADWTWEDSHYTKDGREISRIYQQLDQVSIHNRQDWQAMFVFLEKGILALDSVWADCNDVFKELAQ